MKGQGDPEGNWSRCVREESQTAQIVLVLAGAKSIGHAWHQILAMRARSTDRAPLLM